MPGELRKILLSMLLALGLLGFWAYSCGRYEEGRSIRNEQVAQKQADGHAAAAQQAVAQRAEVAQKQADADARAARAEAELARLKQNLARRSAEPGLVAPVVQDHDAGGGAADLVDLKAVIAQQDEVIKAKDAQLAAKDLRIALEVKRGDEAWAAFQAERDRATALQLALDAQKHVNQASRWRGRIEGFAVGVALGYVGDRR